ncbi:MAG: PLP-dependent transferase [Akkermansiaceae bacterium]
MRNLVSDPACNEADLGVPIPDDRHAVSVCLPTWDSVIGYEEGRDKVISKLQCGYPRFFIHPALHRLFQECEQDVAVEGEKVIVFPNKDVAQRALRFVEQRTGAALRIASYEGLQALILPVAQYAVGMEYWRYSGEVVSSRQALDVLDSDGLWKYDSGDLLRRLEEIGSYDEGDVYLYESGMSAVFAVHRVLRKLAPSKKSLQLDFPYVDVLKVQNNFGTGAVFLPVSEGELFDEALNRIRLGEFSAVFCEVPSNPLLRMIDLSKVRAACDAGNVPLVIDDTVCSAFNVDVKPYADIVTSSLTKWIAGSGNVMAGAVQLVKRSNFYGDFKAFFDDDCGESQSRLYAQDAVVLDEGSKGFFERMKPVNSTAQSIVDFLQEHDAVQQVWYPSIETKDFYEDVKTEHGGYGGLLSFTLKNDKKVTKFFDILRVSKGPSFGTEFSLACPYTMLAHYDELEWAESCGVSRNLIRLSVGTEGRQDLITRLNEAFDAM